MKTATLAGGKSVSIDVEKRTCRVAGQRHIDTYAFDAAPGRVQLYEKLAEIRKKRRRDGKSQDGDYQNALAAARAAVKLIEGLNE